jgi:DNA processing protein
LPTVALIGARDCSEYGRNVASRLGFVFGQKGIQVISGMARGIDGISQEAAVDAGGTSYAVLGSGVDVCYPTGNRRLYEKLKVSGGILSEYPPGTKALAHHFPPRNRIVSGLADAVIVVEARAKSGTLITVDMALEQGREVYVVPGRITDDLSVGCNRLVKMGAGLLLDTEEFLDELREIFARRTTEKTDGCPEKKRRRQAPEEKHTPENTFQRDFSGLPPECETVFCALDFYPMPMEKIREKLPPQYRDNRLGALLMLLCMNGAAVQVSPGHFCRNGDPSKS